MRELWEQYQAAQQQQQQQQQQPGGPAASWQPQGLPGVMEAVSLGVDLRQGGESLAVGTVQRGGAQQYIWFSSAVALDDSCGARGRKGGEGRGEAGGG